MRLMQVTTQNLVETAMDGNRETYKIQWYSMNEGEEMAILFCKDICHAT